jgi:RsiW-degrading membrane proteinase PrsW (M82 family)
MASARDPETPAHGDEPGPPRTVTCPECGATVPEAPFCGACGAHLAHRQRRGAARRVHAYAAFPDESVLRLGVTSSLLPQLAGRSRGPFRVAFGLAAVLLVGVAVARLEAPVIAISALAVPLIFLVYVFEIDPLEVRFALPTAVIFTVGAALGVAWGLLLGPLVSDSLLPAYSASLLTGGVLVSAVLVPVIGELLMILPVALARRWRPGRSEALDGFTAGAAAALGLTLAATLTELAPLLRHGNLATDESVLAIVTQAVVRGISAPLVAAAATGYVGATLWQRRGRGSTAGGRWLASPLVALAVALGVAIGLGFADDAGLPDIVLLVVHLAAAAFALLVLRIGLHHVLLHEQRHVRIGPARACPHCHRVEPAMPFCPACGVAEGATALNPRPLVGADHRARSGPTAIRHLGHRRILAALIAGLGLLSVVLVVLALAVPPTPAKPCTSLACFAPFGPVPVHAPHVYTAAQGWTVQWYPADAVFSQGPSGTSASTSADQFRLDFTSPVSSAEDGELAFIGIPANGQSAGQIVSALQQANAPNAALDYVLPGATVGYQPGYGEAFQTSPNSADGDPVMFEVVISCAVRDNYAVCAYAVGPQVDLNRIVNHPTLARLALSLWADPDINGVRWKGENQP